MGSRPPRRPPGLFCSLRGGAQCQCRAGGLIQFLAATPAPKPAPSSSSPPLCPNPNPNSSPCIHLNRSGVGVLFPSWSSTPPAESQSHPYSPRPCTTWPPRLPHCRILWPRLCVRDSGNDCGVVRCWEREEGQDAEGKGDQLVPRAARPREPLRPALAEMQGGCVSCSQGLAPSMCSANTVGWELRLQGARQGNRGMV